MGENAVSQEFISPQRRRERRDKRREERSAAGVPAYSLGWSSLRLPLRSLRLCGECILAIGVMAVGLVAQGEGERQLEMAVYRETVMGDVAAAIGMYRGILAQQGMARPVAARALWQLGQCQEKLGQRREAHATYARLAREYAAESGIAALARGKLAGWSDALPGPRNLHFEEGDAGKTPPGWFVPQVEKVSGSLAELRRRG